MSIVAVPGGGLRRGADATGERFEEKRDVSPAAIGRLQGWDEKKALECLEGPFDSDAPRFIDYTDHAENYGTAMNPHDQGH